MSNSRSRSALGILALFLLLAVVHTWPLATAPGRLSRNDNADTVLNEWIVAWVAYQVPHDPLHLFDANIFFPDRATLAYSELLMAPAALGAPLLWLGASPVLVYNLLVITGLALTGWAACLLVWRWTGDVVAGIVSGTLIAFNAHTLTRLPQLQALHMEFLPLALLAFDSLLTHARNGSPPVSRWRPALILALAIVLQGATSYYGLVITLVALGVGWLVRPDDWLSTRAWPAIGWLTASAVVTGLLLFPLLRPYTQLGQVRPLDEVALYSATWRDYLSSPSRVHYAWWSSRWFGGATALFPGVTSLALAVVAVFMQPVFRNRRTRMALAFGVVGIALSFGPAMPAYATLYRLFLPLQGIRNAARFGYLAVVACAILAGFGAAAIRQRWPNARWTAAMAICLVAFANLDAFSAPIDYVNADPISPLHKRLRGTTAVVASFPFFQADRAFHNGNYMLESTLHWRPILNGYSGLIPDTYVEHARAFVGFPAAGAMAALRAAGVTHIFVHDRALRDWTDDATADAVKRSPDLTFVESDGDLTLYEIKR